MMVIEVKAVVVVVVVTVAVHKCSVIYLFSTLMVSGLEVTICNSSFTVKWASSTNSSTAEDARPP